MDSPQLAELLDTPDQIVRVWAREGVVLSHRAPGARKSELLRHEILKAREESVRADADDYAT